MGGSKWLTGGDNRERDLVLVVLTKSVVFLYEVLSSAHCTQSAPIYLFMQVRMHVLFLFVTVSS